MMFPIPFGEASRYQKHAAAFSTDKPDDRKSSEPPYLRDGHRRVSPLVDRAPESGEAEKLTWARR